MRICLVRPPTIVSQQGVLQYSSPPLGVAYLAAAIREANHHVTVVDALGEALDQYLPLEEGGIIFHNGLSDADTVSRIPDDVDIIGVSCMFSQEWLTTRSLIEQIRLRFPRTTMVVGGEHVTAVPEYVLATCPAVDLCVLGEGEETFLELLEVLGRRGALDGVSGIAFRDGADTKRTAPRKRIRKIETLPRPAWDIVPIEKYHERSVGIGLNYGIPMPILASRGCPFQCTFCSNPGMWGNLWTVRPVEDVLQEMRDYIDRYGVDNFEFYDLTAIIRKDWIVKLAKGLIEQKFNVSWQIPAGTRSESIDEEVTQLLYQSGCRFVIYAPESGSDEMLKLVKKKINKANMLQSMRYAVRSGLTVKANIILGFPGETPRHVLETYRFIVQAALTGIHDLSAFPFSPYPGSELYTQLLDRGKLTLDDQYFYDLQQYADIGNVTSYSEHLSDRMLKSMCNVGMGIFYAVSFGLRPVRFFRLLSSLCRNKPVTKLANSLNRLIRKRQVSRVA